MGTKRIIGLNATTDFEDDDNIVVDSTTAGTRKMAQSVLKEKLRDSTLSDIHSLSPATDFVTGDTIVVDNANDGPRGMDKDVLMAKTAQNALGSIKNLTSATDAEVSAGVVVIDGSNGTKKATALQIVKEGNGFPSNEIEMTQSYLIGLGSYSIGDVVDLTPEENVNYAYAIVDCEFGDAFTITARSGTNPRAYAFLDGDNKLLEVASANTSYIASTRYAPYGAKKFIINHNKTYSDVFLYGKQYYENGPKSYYDLKKSYNDVDFLVKQQSGVGDIIIPMTRHFNIALGSYSIGDVVSLIPENVGGYEYGVVNCEEDDIFTITAKGGNNPRAYAFLDGDNKLLVRDGSGTSRTNYKITAPAGAKTLIVNNNYSFSGGAFENVKSYIGTGTPLTKEVSSIKKDVDAVSGVLDGIVDAIGVEPIPMMDKHLVDIVGDIGDVINTTPTYHSLYCCAVVECDYGDIFTITAAGGYNPRAYAFLDVDDKLLEVAGPGVRLNEKKIQAPAGAKTLIINNNKSVFSSVQNYRGVPVWNESLKNDINTSTIARSSVYDFVSVARGAVGKAEFTSSTLVLNDYPTEKASHVASFVFVNSKIYFAYYCNYIAPRESVTEQTARFGYCDLDGTNARRYNVMGVGDTFDGANVTMLSDIVVLKDDNDDTVLHLLWTCRLDSDDSWRILHAEYDIVNDVIGTPEYASFVYNNESYDFSAKVLNTLGIATVPNNTMQIMPKITKRVVGADTWYYTGLGIIQFCCVVRTKDFVNWEYVAMPSFQYDPQYEPATYIKGDYLYYFCRQYATKGSGVLSRMNLANNIWDDPVFIEDAQSRPDFIEIGSVLYLIHAAVNRNGFEFVRINETRLFDSYVTDGLYNTNSFYPFAQVKNGESWIVYTEARRYIKLSKYTPEQVDAGTILNKLATALA